MFSKKNNSQSRWLKSSLLCVLMFYYSGYKSQNVLNAVNNFSFQDTVDCPGNAGQLYKSKFWFNPVLIGSPDFFNPCTSNSIISVPQNEAGYQPAKSGDSYSGIATYVSTINDYREYLKNRLKWDLKNNKVYCVTFYYSLSENSAFATSNIGLYFSNDSIISSSSSPPYLISSTPALERTTILFDTLNWTMIQGSYLATGTERFLTIGNFRSDVNTQVSQVKPLNPNPSKLNYSYYYIEDVSVVEISQANASLKDTLYKCSMDNIILGTDSTEFATYSWFPSTGLSCTNCPNPVASPSVTTKYYLTKQQCSATTMDSVIVSILTPTTPANAGPDKTICSGESAILGTDSVANILYSWQGSNLSCTNCPHPAASPDSTTIYILSRQECSFISFDTVKVIIDDCDPTFTVPSVFTPNNDDVNDTWGIKFSSISHIKDFKVDVYDRWGLLVFSSNSESAYAKAPAEKSSTPNLKWDGRTVSGQPCSEGTYFYVISFSKNDEVQKLKGFVSLFR